MKEAHDHRAQEVIIKEADNLHLSSPSGLVSLVSRYAFASFTSSLGSETAPRVSVKREERGECRE